MAGWMQWDAWLARHGLRAVDWEPGADRVRLDAWWEELLEVWDSEIAWPPHGTASTYNNHQCRCDACRTAWSEYRKQQRHLRKGNR
jgi:hypothetical protein